MLFIYRTVSCGSLFSFYQHLQKEFISSENVAFLLGWLRMSVFSDEFFFYEQKEESELNQREIRKRILSCFSSRFYEVLAKEETARRCRLSVMCFYESFQSDMLCRNQAMYLLDRLISILFPEIEVWSY